MSSLVTASVREGVVCSAAEKRRGTHAAGTRMPLFMLLRIIRPRGRRWWNPSLFFFTPKITRMHQRGTLLPGEFRVSRARSRLSRALRETLNLDDYSGVNDFEYHGRRIPLSIV